MIIFLLTLCNFSSKKELFCFWYGNKIYFCVVECDIDYYLWDFETCQISLNVQMFKCSLVRLFRNKNREKKTFFRDRIIDLPDSWHSYHIFNKYLKINFKIYYLKLMNYFYFICIKFCFFKKLWKRSMGHETLKIL